MLPDFVSLKRLFDVGLTSFDYAQHSKDPILSVFPVVRHFEGDKLTKYPIGSRPNESGQTEHASYTDFLSSYQTSVERMIALGHLESIEGIKSMTAQIQTQERCRSCIRNS